MRECVSEQILTKEQAMVNRNSLQSDKKAVRCQISRELRKPATLVTIPKKRLRPQSENRCGDWDTRNSCWRSKVTCLLIGIFFKIPLMILLGRIKRADGQNVCHDFFWIFSDSFEGQFCLFRQSFLFTITGENDRTILRTEIRVLAVDSGWIMTIPEYFQQLVVGNDRGIKFNTHDFGVTCSVGTDLGICGIGNTTPHIADGYVTYA